MQIRPPPQGSPVAILLRAGGSSSPRKTELLLPLCATGVPAFAATHHTAGFEVPCGPLRRPCSPPSYRRLPRGFGVHEKIRRRNLLAAARAVAPFARRLPGTPCRRRAPAARRS